MFKKKKKFFLPSVLHTGDQLIVGVFSSTPLNLFDLIPIKLNKINLNEKGRNETFKN